jgi:hypothetical protein
MQRELDQIKDCSVVVHGASRLDLQSRAINRSEGIDPETLGDRSLVAVKDGTGEFEPAFLH